MMNRNGTSEHPDYMMAETSSKLSWQWQKRASLRQIENSLTEVKEKLSHIHADVDCSRKEDRREIKLLQDDLMIARAKSTRLERVIDELKREKMSMIKMHEDMVNKKEMEMQNAYRQYDEALQKKEEEVNQLRKEWKLEDLNLRHEHDRELKGRDSQMAQLEALHAKKLSAIIGDKEKLRADLEKRLKEKDGEMANVQLSHVAETEELLHGKEMVIQELNDRVDDLLVKLNDAMTFLKGAVQLIELKNGFIVKQREGFRKIVDFIGEVEPKPTKLKGNLWKLAHYIRAGGQAAWKGYINRAQWDQANEDADSILRVANRALTDPKFEMEEEPKLKEELNKFLEKLQN